MNRCRIDDRLDASLTDCKLITSMWFATENALHEAEIHFQRKPGRLDYIHVYLNLISGGEIDRCCPKSCPKDLASAFEWIETVQAKHDSGSAVAGSISVKSIANGSKAGYEKLTVADDQHLLFSSLWCEWFGIESEVECRDNPDVCRGMLIRKMLTGFLIKDVPDVGRWNELVSSWRINEFFDHKWAKWSLANKPLQSIEFPRGMKLQASNLAGATLRNAKIAADLSKSSFVRSDLSGADVSGARFKSCDFTAANLQYLEASNCDFRDAKLDGANVSSAVFSASDFRGVNIDLIDNWETATFKDVKYDESTTLPEDFPQWKHLIWKGKGENPYKLHWAKIVAQTGELALEDLIERLRDLGNDRLKSALSMLKKDNFQLFSDVTDDRVIAVVKSQTDESLVYACTLNASGKFACCTQNLNPCGGLRGAVCKHILVMVIGLANSSNLHCTVAAKWAALSLLEKPTLDKDSMSEIFLKYKGVESGIVDWRPTETLAEDYYAF